jgi:UDP-N-acetylglucosamine:LPS N-acetylglucosamine transferase
MKRIMFANEFGGGLGHITQLATIAQKMQNRYEIIFCVRDNAKEKSVLSSFIEKKYNFFNAFHWTPSVDFDSTKDYTCTLGDSLHKFDFGNVKKLNSAVAHWSNIIETSKPDVIVGDFSPSLRLSCHKLVPMLVIGNGYTIPPEEHNLFPVREWERNVPAKSRKTELDMLKSINQVSKANDKSKWKYISNLFSGDTTKMLTLDIFDPYKKHRKDKCYWPINVPKICPEIEPSYRKGCDIFVYIPHSHYYFMSLLKILNNLNFKTLIFSQDLNIDYVRTLVQSHIGFFKKRADLSNIMPNSKLIIHHGGLGTCHAGLVSGANQLILPDNLERFINAKALVDVGVAKAASRKEIDLQVFDVKSSIEELLSNKILSIRSFEIGKNFENLQYFDSISDIVESIDAMAM